MIAKEQEMVHILNVQSDAILVVEKLTPDSADDRVKVEFYNSKSLELLGLDLQ